MRFNFFVDNTLNILLTCSDMVQTEHHDVD